MSATLESSIRRQVNKLFVNADDAGQKYCNFLTFLDKSCPSELWGELRKVQPTQDVCALAKWARSTKLNAALNDAKRLAFHLTHPAGNSYALECCSYANDSFDRPLWQRKGIASGVTGLKGLMQCGNVIGIDKDDAPPREIELADRYVPLVYSLLILAAWLASDAAWIGRQETNVYLINFGVEAILIGTLRNGEFLPVRKSVLSSK